jgi:hypothetical protein
MSQDITASKHFACRQIKFFVLLLSLFKIIAGRQLHISIFMNKLFFIGVAVEGCCFVCHLEPTKEDTLRLDVLTIENT